MGFFHFLEGYGYVNNSNIIIKPDEIIFYVMKMFHNYLMHLHLWNAFFISIKDPQFWYRNLVRHDNEKSDHQKLVPWLLYVHCSLKFSHHRLSGNECLLFFRAHTRYHHIYQFKLTCFLCFYMFLFVMLYLFVFLITFFYWHSKREKACNSYRSVGLVDMQNGVSNDITEAMTTQKFRKCFCRWHSSKDILRIKNSHTEIL